MRKEKREEESSVPARRAPPVRIAVRRWLYDAQNDVFLGGPTDRLIMGALAAVSAAEILGIRRQRRADMTRLGGIWNRTSLISYTRSRKKVALPKVEEERKLDLLDPSYGNNRLLHLVEGVRQSPQSHPRRIAAFAHLVDGIVEERLQAIRAGEKRTMQASSIWRIIDKELYHAVLAGREIGAAKPHYSTPAFRRALIDFLLTYPRAK
ncbi:MAG: hypothetical protein V1787_02960 [Candidatus Micrarchaeota archaeon]